MREEFFSTDFAEIIQRVQDIDPIAYGRTRNFAAGSVTRLSPYISRGVISTKYVLQSVLKRGFKANQIEKFIQELAWRDYWQLIWIESHDRLNQDFKRRQEPVYHREMPQAVLRAKTGIEAVDKAIVSFYETGYMHNHMRMYVASICCNMAFAHWKKPAQWMFYNLLDGDWASNALSWQWVAGSNSNKKYVANQDNINKYWNSTQKGTFLDVPYEEFSDWRVPEVLQSFEVLNLRTHLPEQKELTIDLSKATLVYNLYNLDPNWRKNEDVNRVLLLEPTYFEEYPVSEKVMQFCLNLAKNIPGIQVFVGSFDELKKQCKATIYKEHPCSAHYEGEEEKRDWMFSVNGYFPSFFAFWKKCKKELNS